MTEDELILAEQMCKDLAASAEIAASQSDLHVLQAILSRTRRLIDEVRRLQHTLEYTENLLARAVVDSDAVELGRQAERQRVRGLFDKLVEIGHDCWSKQTPIDPRDVVGLVISAIDRDFLAAGPIVDMVTPEMMRERIRRLEKALKPFTDLIEGNGFVPADIIKACDVLDERLA